MFEKYVLWEDYYDIKKGREYFDLVCEKKNVGVCYIF